MVFEVISDIIIIAIINIAMQRLKIATVLFASLIITLCGEAEVVMSGTS